MWIQYILYMYTYYVVQYYSSTTYLLYSTKYMYYVVLPSTSDLPNVPYTSSEQLAFRTRAAARSVDFTAATLMIYQDPGKTKTQELLSDGRLARDQSGGQARAPAA